VQRWHPVDDGEGLGAGVKLEVVRVWRLAGGYVVLTVLWCFGLWGLTQLAECDPAPADWYCPTTATALGTVVQVVPATVVAIFVFALGAVFVIAQMVIPGRGSRSIGVLFSSARVQAIVVGGLVLLGGALLIALGTPPDQGDSAVDGSAPSIVSARAAWRFQLATALLAATGVYIVGATILIVWIFLEQISPRAFKDRLTKRPRVVPVLPIRRGRWTSEDLYTALRVLRGWLRTVNRVGESRDLQFGVEGVLTLVQHYAEEVRTDKETPPRLHRRPRDYDEARTSPVTRMTLPPCGSEDAQPPCPGSSSNDQSKRWFADELGRALTRAVESGVRGNTLRRDLDRLLNLFELGIHEFVRCTNDSRTVLTDEAYTLIKHLTEVGLGVRQCEDWQRGWFLAPALRLARIEKYLERISASSAERAGSDLARATLVGWLLVGDAFVSVCSSPGTTDAEAPFLDRSIPLLGDDRKTWNGELTPEEWVALEPEWDVFLESCESRQNRLQDLLNKAKNRLG
jgi:hypothetical protein